MTIAMFTGGGGGEHIEVLGAPMTFLATATETDDCYEVIVAEVAEGSEPLAHRHPWEEFYFILSGTLIVDVGARRHTAGPGSFLTIPARAVHSFEAEGGPASFLHVSMGPGATAAFREFNEVSAGLPEPQMIPAILEINERHGIEIIVPGVGAVRGPADLDRVLELAPAVAEGVGR